MPLDDKWDLLIFWTLVFLSLSIWAKVLWFLLRSFRFNTLFSRWTFLLILITLLIFWDITAFKVLTRLAVDGQSPIADSWWITFHIESSLLTFPRFEIYKAKSSMPSMINSIGLFPWEVPSQYLATMPELLNDGISGDLKVNIVNIYLIFRNFFHVRFLSGNIFSGCWRTIVISWPRSVVFWLIVLLIVVSIPVIILIVLLLTVRPLWLIVIISRIMTRLMVTLVILMIAMIVIPIISIIVIMLVILVVVASPIGRAMIVMMVHWWYRGFLNLFFIKVEWKWVFKLTKNLRVVLINLWFQKTNHFEGWHSRILKS